MCSGQLGILENFVSESALGCLSSLAGGATGQRRLSRVLDGAVPSSHAMNVPYLYSPLGYPYNLIYSCENRPEIPHKINDCQGSGRVPIFSQIFY